MSDVNALMDKLKSTVAYKQFDAPRAADQAWPVLERMARAKSALSQPESQMMASAIHIEVAPAPIPPAPVGELPVAARAAEVQPNETRAAGSLFERLQADGAPAKSATFSRYGVAQPAQDAPQALSEIFERIGRKAL